jgi:hypothetical protein
MPRERYALISRSATTPVTEKRRKEQLSPHTAIFSIAMLSIAAWVVIIAVVLALV